MAIREGKWRCPYCSVVNRGAELKCSGCGATRDKDVSFFLEEDAPEVTDQQLLETARAGADWLCESCGTSNRPQLSACRNCGAERGSAPSRLVGDVPPPSPPPATTGPPFRFAGCFKWVTLALALLVTGFCYFALRKTEEAVTVSGFEWRRSIEVEAYRTVRESGWERELPGGARVLSQSREVHHTENEQIGTRKVKVGKRDLGNGFFEDVYRDQPVYRQRPVYATRVQYEVDKWVPDRTARAEGRDQSPAWPDPGLGPRERERGRSDEYTVVLRGTREYRMTLPESRWASMRAGQQLQAVIRGGRTVVELR